MSSAAESTKRESTSGSTATTRILKLAGFVLIVAAGLPSASYEWYWKQEAHIPPQVAGEFWGNDIVSDAFRWAFNSAVRPVWNRLFGMDSVRYIVAIVYVGFLAAIGTDLYKVAKNRLVD